MGRGDGKRQGTQGCRVRMCPLDGFWSSSPEKPRPPPSACGSPGRGGKGTHQSIRHISAMALCPGLSPSQALQPLYLEVRAVVCVSVHNLLLPPVPGQHRHHLPPCQVCVQLGGEDADASSGQSLGEEGKKEGRRKEGQLKPPWPALSPSPPSYPRAGSSLSLLWLSHGV